MNRWTSIPLRIAVMMAAALIGGIGFASADQPSPNRADAGGSSAATPTGPGSLTGLWASIFDTRPVGNVAQTLNSARIDNRDLNPLTATGEPVPLQPWAAALLQKRVKAAQSGDPEPSTLTMCLPGAPVFLLGSPFLIQIMESKDQVAMLFEEQNHFRIIRLNGQHPVDPDPSYFGDSIGHWEGDTLVVDTIGLKENTPLNRMGMPHSDALHLVERYRRVDPRTLEVRITLDDPKTFTHPWDAKVNYHAASAGTRITEYVCDNNRDYNAH